MIKVEGGEISNKGNNMTKEQMIFTRILGLFFVLYGFLMLSQPQQYGLGLLETQARFVGILLVLGGIILAIRK